VADESNVPTEWSATKNVKWKVPLPDPGNSTPIVWGDRIFLTGANADGSLRYLACYRRADGKKLWSREVAAEPKEPTHETNPYGSSSPVTDGEVVVAWYGSGGIVAYDLDGKELWKKDVGKFTHVWGYASSPIIVDNRVIVSCGPGLRALLVALDKKTGEELWLRELPDAQSAKPDQFKGSWSTPVVVDTKAGKQVLLSLPKELIAFDPATGKTLWSCGGLSDLAYTSPLVNAESNIAVAMSGYHGPAIACRIGGEGDVTETNRLWRHDDKNPQRVGSGVIVDGYIYILNEPGLAWCLDLATGERKWEQRIGGRTWASSSYVDGKLYVINDRGETLVIRPSPERFDLIATNKLDGETTRASLAFSDGQIFVRSHEHLYCIGE